MQTKFPSNLQTIWQAIAEHISAQVSKDTYQRWFKAISMTAADENEITLTVPNNIYQLWIESNYLSLLQSLGRLGARRPSLDPFPDGHRESISRSEDPMADAPKTGEWRESRESGARPARAHHEIARASARPPMRRAAQRRTGGMNPRNTFDTFVVGANNQFAHAASLAVSQAPARTYNPLFIYGGVGLGKTHLMQAIGQHVGRARPQRSR